MCKQNSGNTIALIIAQNNCTIDILHYYFTPVGYAIFTKKLGEARQLLEDGVDVCMSGANNKTPLMIAVEKNDLEAIKLLFEFGADFTMPTALLEAINLGNVQIIDFFIKNNVVINRQYQDGTTPLIRALEKGNFDVVKILVENGADVNFANGHFTPLFEALKLDNCEVAKYLISKGASMEAKYLLKFPMSKEIN
ncbi:putative ankyrin repeat protein RBE_0220 [Tribolium madens]|uniref:putative ankyrin repeat protein RBE_0220 n=1 Tax=Tribolium madens TaxID=41895 RepID=UPI001CF72AA7|nr:putative ankyrin repeat protein RBE_0220 [Tribolium madens]